jgi:hypothetical protein
MPFGVGHTKPHHFREMLRIAWANKDEAAWAWKVLTQGVCDGCALGTSGLSDWTIEGTHLCMVRLELLRLNTMGAFDPARLSDVASLRKLSSRELRELQFDPVVVDAFVKTHHVEGVADPGRTVQPTPIPMIGQAASRATTPPPADLSPTAPPSPERA